MKEQRQANTYAVVDLEATGTGSDAKIIQIGIAIVEDGQIRETFETDINPYEPLAPHIVELTGITDQQLQEAPSFNQVAERIMDLIGEAIFVAHNVSFDANLLAEALFFEGYELRTPRVDTVELSQMFFPTLDRYSLTSLSDQLGLGLEQAHTAMADAGATAQLLLRLQQQIATLPKVVLEQILNCADHLLYESRLVIEEVYQGMESPCPLDMTVVHGIGLKKRREQAVALSCSEAFTDNIRRLGLSQRPQQVQFAQLVEERLDEPGQVHLIQAQAGLGKTLGYLLPLLTKTDEKILVLVPTLLLQEQLLQKEGNLLQQVFQLSVASIKSPRHYLKLDRFWEFLQTPSQHRMVNQLKILILVWICQTETGDVTELKQLYRFSPFFESLLHDGFLAADSLFGDWDFWQRTQQTASHSRVLVTNHAYFLNQVEKDVPYLQQRLLVIDEAQKFLLATEAAASRTVSVFDFLQLLQQKKEQSQTLLEQRLYESCVFEVNHLVMQARQSKIRELDKEALHQLQQNLQELADTDLVVYRELLTDYQHFWVEEKWSATQRQALLRASKQDWLTPVVRLPYRKIFCISATLDISNKVTLADLLGFKEASLDRLPTPQLTNQRVLLLENSLNPREVTPQVYAIHLLGYLKELLTLEIPILLLFTSHELLQACSQELGQQEIPHLAQGKDDDEGTLKRRFDKGECLLLLGTGVFWEGVDFRCQPFLIQVITSLPFDNPRDRLVQKIAEHLRRIGRHPFYEYSLPMMMMRLQQAIGRVNRSDQQASVVIVGDSRLLTKSYGRQVRRFLNRQYSFQIISSKELKQTIQDFFEKRSDLSQ